jgi:hypothetical protein
MVLGLVGFVACGETRLHVTVEADGALPVDTYQVRVGDRLGVADPRSSLDVLLADSVAGAPTTIELWGLYAGRQVAYGKAAVTPVQRSTVDVTVSLTAVTCGNWCQPGSRTCDADATRECAQAPSGCFELGAKETCPAASPFCSNGACAATCVDECTTGMSACDGAVAMRRCGDFDSDSCTDWSPATSCGANQRCSDGTCTAPQTCQNTSDECDDGDGCTEGDTCNGSTCSGEPRDCADEPPQCLSTTTLRLYGATGTCSPMTGACTNSYVDATCAHGCTDGACAPHVAAGGDNTCALAANGTLECWGEMKNSSLPPQTFAAISVKRYHGCGTTRAGATVCWARDSFGNTYGELDVPTNTTFKAVSAGDGFTCGIRANDTLDCWGDMLLQQLDAPTGTFTAVNAGVDHACAIRTDSTVACWGRNDQGQASSLGGAFTHVAAGYAFSCGIRPGGAIECWGQIANIPPGSFVALSAGFDHACALRSDGIPKCWGANTMGKATPMSGAFSSVTAGDQHTCGTRTNGTIACWGDPAKGATDVPPGF